MTFETTRRQPTQEHFYIIEVDLPIITGKCELVAGVEGFGTPLSCPIQDGTSATATKTYRFCTDNTPILPGLTDLHRCVIAVNETTTELDPSKGLAFRGRLTISFQDFDKADPNTERTSGVDAKNQGTFFGKWKKRNIFENREVRSIKYRKSPTLNIATDGETSYYLGRELKTNGKDKYQLVCVDELSRIEFDQAQIPAEQNGTLRSLINLTIVAIPVDSVTDWLQKTPPYVVRIGEEFLTVLSVTDNLTATATLNTKTRGSAVGAPEFLNLLTETTSDIHGGGDSVFICETFDNVNIATALETMYLSVGIPSSIIPIADWLAEMALWHPSDTINTILYESEDADIAIINITEPYLLSSWFDPIDREIKLRAISGWLESSSTLTEGVEIDYQSISVSDVESLRYSRAFIGYGKRFLSDPEEDSSFKKGSFGIRPELETEEFYGVIPKVKKFNNSRIINKSAGDLLVSRFLQQYGITPQLYRWTTQERNLSFKTGDIKNLSTLQTPGFDGLPSTNVRAQILNIQPIFTPTGREYKVKALTYLPAISTDAVFTILSATELNLFILAGAPPSAVTVTFIFDGGVFKSTDVSSPSVRAGGFAVGSNIIIILRNGADWQSKAGRGGSGGFSSNILGEEFAGQGGAGQDSGIVYDAQGIDTDIHLSGADPESGTALGTLKAPGGSDSGFDAPDFDNAGDGGDGGKGIDSGLGGPKGIADGTGTDGVDGIADVVALGVNGTSNDGNLAGLAGKGIIKNGAVVRVFGDTPANFINGNGDTPDP